MRTSELIDKIKQLTTTLVPLAVLVVLWELAVRIFSIPEFLIPAPSLVVKLMTSRNTMLIEQLYVTLRETKASINCVW